jgi:choline dehydrogenase-like flavoprotein
VIGAGAGGCVIAGRLSQTMPDARIALIEADGERLGLTTKVPGIAFIASTFARRNFQDHQHIEGAAAKLDRDPIGAELPAVRQQPEPTELDSPQGLVGQLHGYLLRCFNQISYSIWALTPRFAQRSANKFRRPGRSQG